MMSRFFVIARAVVWLLFFHPAIAPKDFAMSRLEPMFSVEKDKAGLDRIIVTQSDGQRIIVVGVGDGIDAYDSGTCGKAAQTPRIIPKES